MVRRIHTRGHDHINDIIVIYREHGRYTDDGYYFNEMETMLNWDKSKIVDKCKKIAEWFFCEFDEKTEEITCDVCEGKRGETYMLQTITALATIINEERMNQIERLKK